MGEPQSEPAASAVAYREPPPFSLCVEDHALSVYPGGADRRRALFDMIRDAKKSLKLCFYIFAEDRVGTELRDALAEAAGRGVAVTLIVDSFGATASAQFLAPLCDRGGRFHCFSPRWSHRYLIRNHQKMVIADDRRAMIGGFNIADDYFSSPETNGWNDLALTIEGPAVSRLAHWFARLEGWTDDPHPHFREIRRAVRQWGRDEGRIRWLVGGPSEGLSKWAACVSHDLARSSRLDMLMAYFSPSKKLLRAIGRIASRGETRLVMAAKSDNGATIAATRSLYDYLLGKRARVWEFSPCKLHTKLIVLDDVVYIGSANFDMRSLYLNLELMLRIEDAELAERMRDHIDRHIAASQRIDRQWLRANGTLWNRFRWNLGWLLVAVIDYTVTRRLNLGM